MYPSHQLVFENKGLEFIVNSRDFRKENHVVPLKFVRDLFLDFICSFSDFSLFPPFASHTNSPELFGFSLFS